MTGRLSFPEGTRIAVVTGASSGIGAASARALAEVGYHVVVGARRTERVEALADEIGGTAVTLDVTSEESVAALSVLVPTCHLLLNNAGGALGTDSIADARLEDWQWMYDVNVLGTLRVTKALLPALSNSGDGQVINVGSIAAREPYKGGGGYNVAKHGVAAMTRVLRLEMLGRPIRVSEIDPGMVETEFSLVRFGGDRSKADAVYEGTRPLTAEDVADAVVWVAQRPPHVNIDHLLMLATDQTSAQVVHRS